MMKKGSKRMLMIVVSLVVISSIIPWILIACNNNNNDDDNNIDDVHYYYNSITSSGVKIMGEEVRRYYDADSINNKNINNSDNDDEPSSSPSSPHQELIMSEKTTTIRKWGCHRNETPFIFVHIGKSGGGMIRARLAASAQNYTRKSYDWSDPTLDNHYYELPAQTGPGRSSSSSSNNNNKHHYAYFCNSRFKHHRLPNTTKFGKTYEGNMACYAKTPIGMALGCPETTILGDYPPRCKGCDEIDSDEECNIVYTSHNVLGNELHFLPPKYLTKWWINKFHNKNNNHNNHNPKKEEEEVSSTTLLLLSQQILNEFIRLQESNYTIRWCPQYNISRSKVIRIDHINSKYTKCTKTISPMMDSLFDRYWKEEQEQEEMQKREQKKGSSHVGKTTTTTTTHNIINYAPIYASLPIHRTTVLREPFSWLLSKFFWHKREAKPGSSRSKAECDDIDIAIFGDDDGDGGDGGDGGIIDGGWATEYCINYILYLCGDDCVNRYDYLLFEMMNNNNKKDRDHQKEKATMFLKQIELQAATNLRQSISVVGLLNESDSFLDMISKRIHYIDTTRNDHVLGGRHGPNKNELRKERIRCLQKYNDNRTFQNLMRQKSPCIQALERLYFLGVEVNRFQQLELKECV